MGPCRRLPTRARYFTCLDVAPTIICEECGSEEVTTDAHVEWSKARQEWHISEVRDDVAWCCECQAETTLLDDCRWCD